MIESENRLEGINFGIRPTRNMRLALDYLTPSGIVPQPNKYYTFVYKAKTPGITYDTFPLILCGSVFPTGFNGMNVHWGEVRQYSWGEVRSNLYELNQAEYETLQGIPLANFVSR